MSKRLYGTLGLFLAAVSPACSSKSDSPPSNTGTGADAGGSGAGTGTGTGTGAGTGAGTVSTNSGPGTVSATPGTCAKTDIKIFFSPMYSAFDGMHTFQVPAIVTGVASNTITWSSSDPTTVGLQPDATTGGVMITMLKAGMVDIIATAGGTCGSSKLTISQAEVDDWTAGDMRYNNGVVLARPGGRDGGAGNDGGGGGRPDGGGGNDGGGGGGRPDGGNSDGGRPDGGGNGGLGPVADGGTADRLACTNCHGPTATNAQFRTVAHTPEQIGGFSDDELRGIFEGRWPANGNPFDATIVSQRQWEGFHKWNMTDDEAAGVIIYLRALTPTAQTGMRNFGGNGPRNDGGARDGGGGN